MRKSTVSTNHDDAGDYEVEVFDCPKPKRLIVCAHGGGVRRWDGEKFFYAVAEHYDDSAVLLVDQNQQDGDYIRINPLTVAAERINRLIAYAKKLHPGAPIVVMGHSFGCGVVSQLKLEGVNAIVLVTPAAGRSFRNYVDQFGESVANGLQVTSSDGIKKEYTAEFMDSIKNISWEEEYARLAKGPIPVYVFEAGADEIIGEERFAHREIPFTKYFILDRAPHNLVGKPLADFFAKLDPLP